MPCRTGRLAAWLATLLLAAGCAGTPQTRALQENVRVASLPAAVELAHAPFFSQDDRQCGPAALATALTAAGIATSPETLRPQVYLPGRDGSLQVEMLAAARRHGAVPYLVQPELADLLAEVADGTPVVVLQNLGLDWYPVWHYAVVVGYDLPQAHLLLRSGGEARQVLPLSTFERTWARGGHWAFVALPPGKLPVTASEQDYLAAVVPLEAMGRVREAHAAYRAARGRWQDSLAAAIGLGNTAYALGRLEDAQAAFRAASIEHPESAVAHNNLAYVLARLKRYAEAIGAARTAVELGGPQEAEARRTLAEITAARAQ